MPNYESKYHLTKWLLWMILAGILTYMGIKSLTPEEKLVTVITIKDTTNYDVFSETNLNHMMAMLEMDHPEIVMRQAKLETGNFTSRRFKEYNNLFGFQVSDSSICKYSNWKESVIAYKSLQMRKLRDNEDYYKFLIRIKYASDPDYIKKLKQFKDV